MHVPWEELQPETLRNLIEEFVTRDGTDYGVTEVSLETKVKQVMQLLRKGEAVVVFDEESESASIVSKR